MENPFENQTEYYCICDSYLNNNPAKCDKLILYAKSQGMSIGRETQFSTLDYNLSDDWLFSFQALFPGRKNDKDRSPRQDINYFYDKKVLSFEKK